MRETFTSLQTTGKDYTQNTATTETSVLTFLKKEINLTTRDIYAIMRTYSQVTQKTAATVANQQYYHYPQDTVNIETITLTIGTQNYTLHPIHSQDVWNGLNAIDFAGSAIPQFYLPRRYDFGIWPTPTAVHTITLNQTTRFKDMTQEDYTTGTVAVTENSATVTGTGTTWTASMIGRWFSVTGDGYWYKITAVNSTTSLTLESVYEGVSGSGSAYTIGESPEIPLELQHLIPHRVAAKWFAGPRKDAGMSEFHNRMFWTGDADVPSTNFADARGGLIGAIKRYSDRSNSSIVRRIRDEDVGVNKIWATTIA